MFRLFFVLLLVVALVGTVALLRYLSGQNSQTTKQLLAGEQNLTSEEANHESRIAALENDATAAALTASASSHNETNSNASSSELFTSMEAKISNLTRRVTTLEQATSSGTSSRSPLYIPLGVDGASTSLSWQSIPNFSETIDPSDYPGYTSMQLEVSLRVYEGNGAALAQLYDSNDGISLTASEVSTPSQDYTWVSSQPFTLPSGAKTYVLQLESLTGYEADAQTARLKINF